MKGKQPMNRMMIISAYLSALAAESKPTKSWTAVYLPLIVGETGKIEITIYADTYEEAHRIMWKHKPEHYYLSYLGKN